MAGSCPDCGAEVEFTIRPAQIRRGSCTACGHTYALFEDPTGESPGAVSGLVAVPGEAAAERPAPGAGAAVLACSECGGGLELRAAGPGRFTAVCAECETETTYVPAGEAPERGERRPPARGRFGARDEERGGPPRARPCRECGAPLRFTTNPDGTVEGQCTSCDNRFTLQPRTFSGGSRGFRGGGRFPPRGEGRGGPGFRGRSGGRFGRGPPRPVRRRPSDEEDAEDDEGRDRRRRPRRRED